MTVLVTGATGTVGAHVVRHLLRAGRGVRAPASAHLPEGVEVVAGDLTDAATLAAAFHAGQAYHLTGPEVVTPRDKVRMLAEATGRDLRFEELTPHQTRREWVAEGGRPERLLFQAFPPGLGDAELVETLLRVYGTPNEVGTNVTDVVEKVTGRPARTFAEWAAEHADAFRP